MIKIERQQKMIHILSKKREEKRKKGETSKIKEKGSNNRN